MNIGMLIARFPPYVGGTEIQCDRLSRTLAARGQHVVILTELPSRHPPIQESPKSIEVRRFQTFGFPPLSSLIFCLRALWNLVRQPQFDVLHAHMIASPSILAVMAGKLTHKKTVVKVACSGQYGDVSTAQHSFLGRWKLKLVLQNVDRLVCLTREMEKELLAAGASRNKIVRIPNGIDTDKFRPSRNDGEKRQLQVTLGLSPDSFNILFMGRLTPQKRPDLVIEAFQQAFAHQPKMKLVMLGDGPLRAELQKRVQSAGFQSQVKIPGNHPESELYTRCFDLFVLPSEAEGMSNSLLEAMATGLPSIATRNGATEELIKDGENGILIPPGDAGALANAMISLVNDPARAVRLGKAARELMQNTYQMNVVAQQYETLYTQLLREGPRQ
jgi:glycosyltransferase involved in cell wall biosynthesis